jgi:hypothetical protein
VLPPPPAAPLVASRVVRSRSIDDAALPNSRCSGVSASRMDCGDVLRVALPARQSPGGCCGSADFASRRFAEAAPVSLVAKGSTFETRQVSHNSVAPCRFWDKAIGNRFWEKGPAGAERPCHRKPTVSITLCGKADVPNLAFRDHAPIPLTGCE